MSTHPIFIYFHMAAIGRYQEVLKDMYSLLHLSGLLDRVVECRCFITGPPENKDWILSYFTHPKCKIMAHQENSFSYERFTLDVLHQHAQESQEPFQVLYIHSKGVSKKQPQDIVVSDVWRKLMMHTLVTHYSSCLHHLETHETVGSMFVTIPSPHYSGNFWWANSSYIRTLPKIRDPMIYYIDTELWIGLSLQNAVSLYQRGGNRTTESDILSIRPESIPLLEPTLYKAVHQYSGTETIHPVHTSSKILLHLGYDAFELRNHGLCFDLCESHVVRVIYDHPPVVFSMTGQDLKKLFPTLFYRHYHPLIL
jgi:hypothetical protein